MWKSLLAVAVGSALGALLRWSLGMKLNGLLPGVPPGTLLAAISSAPAPSPKRMHVPRSVQSTNRLRVSAPTTSTYSLSPARIEPRALLSP